MLDGREDRKKQDGEKYDGVKLEEFELPVKLQLAWHEEWDTQRTVLLKFFLLKFFCTGLGLKVLHHHRNTWLDSQLDSPEVRCS
jgi:hypothetical protein